MPNSLVTDHREQLSSPTRKSAESVLSEDELAQLNELDGEVKQQRTLGPLSATTRSAS